MLSERVERKINCMDYNRLEKLSDWLWKRYENKKITPIAKYITRLHYLQEEGRAGLL